MRLPNDLQLYLRQYGPEKLKEELGINYYEHPSLPLVGFKYNQISSPKMHPVVQQCRGTVLEKGTWNLIAQPFLRFYNLGEGTTPQFDWGDFTCTEKCDGSLQILYYYNNEWQLNTSGSFGFQDISPLLQKSWRDFFFETFESTQEACMDDLCKECTYIFELVSPYNKIVRKYDKPDLILLGAFDLRDSSNVIEFKPEQLNVLSILYKFKQPQQFKFKSLKEVEEFLSEKEKNDPTYEGVVVRDRNNLRLKIKSKTYITLHHMAGNGCPGLKDIIHWILKGEVSELLAYFPEFTQMVNEIQIKINDELTTLKKVWEENKHLENQKDFAIAIKGKTKFTGLLFNLRKVNPHSTIADLEKLWLECEDHIFKALN